MKRRMGCLILSTGLLAACAPMGARPSSDGPHPASQGPNVVADLQTRLQAASEALQLSPTQQVVWDTYQERVAQLMADQMKAPAYSARSDAPRQIGQRVDLVRNRLTALEDIQDAAAHLYAALDEGQKRTADRVLPPTVPEIFTSLSISVELGGNRPEHSESRGRRGGKGGAGGMGGMGGMGGGPGGMGGQ